MCADPEEQNLEDGPLFDDDTSKPIEAFPRVNVYTDGWEMFIRHPPKKKMTAQRFWKKIFVRLIMQGDHTPSRGGQLCFWTQTKNPILRHTDFMTR